MADNPIHIPAVFAVNGLKSVIQKVRQVGQAIQDFTWVDGTPAVTMIDKEDGGLAPKGQDFNGVLNALSEHTVFNQNGGRYKWSQDVIDNYGGYSKDFIIQSDNGQTEWISLVDNNTRNPNNGLGSDWKIYAGQGSVPAASSTTAGIVRVLNVLTSTDIAAAASAATVKFLNDFILKFNVSLSENGYLKIPSGDRVLILQWGFNNSSTSPNTNTRKIINFNTQFPTRSLVVMSTPSNVYSDGYLTTSSESPTKDSFTLVSSSSRSGNFNFTWLAIGY